MLDWIGGGRCEYGIKNETHAVSHLLSSETERRIRKHGINDTPNNDQHPILPHRHPHHLRTRTAWYNRVYSLIRPHLLHLIRHIDRDQIPRIRSRIRRHIPRRVIHRAMTLRLHARKIIPLILRRHADAGSKPDIARDARRDLFVEEESRLELLVRPAVPVALVAECCAGVGGRDGDGGEGETAVCEELAVVGEEGAVVVDGLDVGGGAGEGGDGC